MQFGRKISNAISGFGRKAVAAGAKYGKKFADIVERGNSFALPIGMAIGAVNPVLGAEIVALSTLAAEAGQGARAIANALEKKSQQP
jgi:hypothetical protein